jgi:hypothetical protein
MVTRAVSTALEALKGFSIAIEWKGRTRTVTIQSSIAFFVGLCRPAGAGIVPAGPVAYRSS